MITKEDFEELLRLSENGRVYHRESQTLEFKEQFNFAAFANNKGGFLIFGVTDSPNREPNGLSEKAINQFEKIDEERITGFLNEIFSGHITWSKEVYVNNDKTFAAFKIVQAHIRPVIAKKDAGKDQTIKNGEIYYRYGGRTQKIEFSELEALINERIERSNRDWMDLLSKIGKIGPTNAAIYDLENSVLEKDNSKILVVDEELSRKIKFIKEGEFEEKKGAPTLKLVGDVLPINKVDVIKHVKENLLKEYPLTATQLCNEVKKKTGCSQKDVWTTIRENEIKFDKKYSVYNFRNKSHEDEFETNKNLANGTPSIYKNSTIDYIATSIKNKKVE